MLQLSLHSHASSIILPWAVPTPEAVNYLLFPKHRVSSCCNFWLPYLPTQPTTAWQVSAQPPSHDSNSVFMYYICIEWHKTPHKLKCGNYVFQSLQLRTGLVPDTSQVFRKWSLNNLYATQLFQFFPNQTINYFPENGVSKNSLLACFPSVTPVPHPVPEWIRQQEE